MTFLSASPVINPDMPSISGSPVINPDMASISVSPVTNPDIVKALYSTNLDEQIDTTQKLRIFLQSAVPSNDEVIETGIVPRIVEILKNSNNRTLQFEAAWVLTNLAAGSSVLTLRIVEAEAVPVFVQLLGSDHEDVQEQAVWALGNIAGDSPACRDHILDYGTLVPLLKLLSKSARLCMVRHVAWAISNLCRGDPSPIIGKVSSCLPVLSLLLFQSDPEVLAYALWALWFFSNNPDGGIQAVIEAGVCRQLVSLLRHNNYNVVWPALQLVENIVVKGDDVQKQMILNCSVLPCLLELRDSTKEPIQKKACYIISVLTAFNRQQIQTIDADILPVGPVDLKV